MLFVAKTCAFRVCFNKRFLTEISPDFCFHLYSDRSTISLCCLATSDAHSMKRIPVLCWKIKQSKLCQLTKHVYTCTIPWTHAGQISSDNRCVYKLSVIINHSGTSISLSACWTTWRHLSSVYLSYCMADGSLTHAANVNSYRQDTDEEASYSLLRTRAGFTGACFGRRGRHSPPHPHP